MQDQYIWPDGHKLTRVVNREFGLTCPRHSTPHAFQFFLPDKAASVEASCIVCDQRLPDLPV